MIPALAYFLFHRMPAGTPALLKGLVSGSNRV